MANWTCSLLSTTQTLCDPINDTVLVENMQAEWQHASFRTHFNFFLAIHTLILLSLSFSFSFSFSFSWYNQRWPFAYYQFNGLESMWINRILHLLVVSKFKNFLGKREVTSPTCYYLFPIIILCHILVFVPHYYLTIIIYPTTSFQGIRHTNTNILHL